MGDTQSAACHRKLYTGVTMNNAHKTENNGHLKLNYAHIRENNAHARENNGLLPK